jgi:hypothetical protein
MLRLEAPNAPGAVNHVGGAWCGEAPAAELALARGCSGKKHFLRTNHDKTRHTIVSPQKTGMRQTSLSIHFRETMDKNG